MPPFSSKSLFVVTLTILVVSATCASAWAAVAEQQKTSPEQAIAPAHAPISLNSFESDAAALIGRGIHFRREHRDREALASFREAFDLKPTGKAQAQIALAEQALADWLPAEQDLVAALSNPDPWIEANRTHLEQSLAVIRRHLAWLVVSTNADGAQLILNGRAMGSVSKDEIRVVAGSVTVMVEAIGFHPAQSSVVIEPGEVARQELRLVPRTLVLTPSVATPTRSSTLSRPHEKDAALARAQRNAAWVFAAGASLLLTASIVAYAVGEHHASQYNDDARCVYGDLSRQERCGHYKDQAILARALAIAGYGATAGAGIVAGILFERASRSNQLNRGSGLEFSISWRAKW